MLRFGTTKTRRGLISNVNATSRVLQRSHINTTYCRDTTSVYAQVKAKYKWLFGSFEDTLFSHIKQINLMESMSESEINIFDLGCGQGNVAGGQKYKNKKNLFLM